MISFLSLSIFSNTYVDIILHWQFRELSGVILGSWFSSYCIYFSFFWVQCMGGQSEPDMML